MFSFIKNKLQKIYDQFSSRLGLLFSSSKCDKAGLEELEKILISADTGAKTTSSIIEGLKKDAQRGHLENGQDLKTALEKQLISILTAKKQKTCSSVFLLVGINGSGKTTLAGKLAHILSKQKKKILMAAADTFRAAAPEQLAQWAEDTSSDIVIGNPGQDPASVVFTACEKFKQNKYDILIIDTAGRLQTKINLMKELEKIKRIISRQLPGMSTCTLLTIDSMLGQNSLEQARLFNESTDLNGIVLTKMDGTGRGGIIFSISQELDIPISYITFGEQPEDIQVFNAHNYVKELLQS